jgi:hypothetical protein
VDLIAGAVDGQAGAALGVVAQGGDDGAEVLCGELDAERDGGEAMVFDDGGEAFDDALGLAFAVFEVLLGRGVGDGCFDFELDFCEA